MSSHHDAVERAIAHVDSVSRGALLDRSLRITLNFHPDRNSGPGSPHSVIESLVADGVYRSQFETGTSNGGLTAHPGGARWGWEHRLFGGAYDDAPAQVRPKYGALNHRRRGIGGAARFGSSHLRLREHMLDRATFCFPDSFLEPTDFGTARCFDLIRLTDQFDAAQRTEAMEAETGGVLDDYVECQVHGVVSMTDDVEALVLDPSYRGTDIEVHATRLGVPVEWHEGRVLSVAELLQHTEFRGPGPVELGQRIAVDERLDAQIIGVEANRGVHDPQTLKQVWHLVARYGSPQLTD